MPERWRRLDDMFAAALALPPAARNAYLDDACRDDAGLRKEIQELLDAERAAQSGLFIRDALSVAARDVVERRVPDAVGKLLGPYRLVRELGHGGMGTVFLAVRNDRPHGEEFAIKVIRPEHQTPELFRRFERERTILARLANPGIARLLDSGSTPEGVGYLVMEYVDGAPIDGECDARGYNLARRIALFRRVCAAVQHAHSAHVIHRDLKPTNILMTKAGAPKLVDFGIAKQLIDGIGRASATTGMAGRMTPAYASPEQLRGEPLTVATDVYSLGVLLYQLVTRRPPYDLRGELMARQRAIVSESDPSPPSIAASHGGVPWAREIDQALDLIILRALRKEPADRYRSVSELASELEHWQELTPR